MVEKGWKPLALSFEAWWWILSVKKYNGSWFHLGKSTVHHLYSMQIDLKTAKNDEIFSEKLSEKKNPIFVEVPLLIQLWNVPSPMKMFLMGGFNC